MSFGAVSDQSILTTPATFTASVAAAISHTTEPSTAPTVMQSMINVVVSAATCNTNRDYKIPTSDGWSYCWSHRKLRNKKHISTTYKNEKDGHKFDATLDNQMAGKKFWNNTGNRG